MELNVEAIIFFRINNENYKFYEGTFFKEEPFGWEESGLTDEQCEEFYEEYKKIENNRIGDYV